MRIIEGFDQYTKGKKYEEKISLEEFKAIPVGLEVVYLGARCNVDSNNGYILGLSPLKGGEQFSVNLNQFIKSGFINSNL